MAVLFKKNGRNENFVHCGLLLRRKQARITEMFGCMESRLFLKNQNCVNKIMLLLLVFFFTLHKAFVCFVCTVV